MTRPVPALPAGLTGCSLTDPLCRMVERTHLENSIPPNFLFTSGRPGRYNSRGVEAVYFSEDMATAGAEAERYREGSTTQRVVYWAHPHVTVLDLEDPATLAALGLKEADLFKPWRMLKRRTATVTQRLGSLLSRQTLFAGLRFPSDAAHERGNRGFNIVLFRDAVIAPSFVSICNDKKVEIQRWPMMSDNLD